MRGPPVTMAEANARVEDCLELLRALVESESPTGDVAANGHVAEIVESAMDRAGARVERIPAPGLGVHLVGRFPGRGQGGRAILLLGHMDTVHPIGTLASLPFRVDGDRVWGPGVYDMKGGLAASLVALRLLAERDSGPGSGLSFLVTCDEEVGSMDSRPHIEAEARVSKLALVVEPSGPGGAVKTRRKGVGAYALRIRGRAAHAGIEPERGASAVHEMAYQIGRITALADHAAGTTVGVGTVRGGTAENVVAAAAECTIDVRFWTRAEARRVDRALRAAVAHDSGCTLTLEGGINRGPLEKTDEAAGLYRAARRVARRLGIELREAATGGASDGNVAAAVGCPTLDGLGPDGGGAHTQDEYILRSDLPRRIGLLASLFQSL